MIKYFAIFFLILCAACTNLFFHTNKTDETPLNFQSVNLYLGRGSIKQADFEQYSLFSDNIFFECGTYKHHKNLPQSQSIFQLSKEAQLDINQKLSTLYNVLAESNFKFKSAGSGIGMADPGVLELSFSHDEKDFKIRTSFDSIVAPQSLAEIKTKHLIKSIRGAIKASPCGLNDFYGLGKTSK